MASSFKQIEEKLKTEVKKLLEAGKVSLGPGLRQRLR